MRLVRFLSLGLLAASIAAMPAQSTAQAAGYVHFTSPQLHFSIDYPSGWHARTVLASSYATFELSPTEAVTVNWYEPLTSRIEIHSLTTKLAAAYRRSGLKTAAISYAGGRGYFTGAGKLGSHSVLVKVVTTVLKGQGYSIALAAPRQSMTSATAIFAHMVNSFSGR